MSLTCSPNKPTPSYQARMLQQTNRDIGLSPVYNVNIPVSPCIENFTNPTYTLSGACKPVSGLTLGCPSGYTLTSGSTCISGTTTASTITVEPPCLYNLSETSEINLIFNLTGSTDYSDYFGEFCYKMINFYESAPIPDKCIKYSGITGTSIVQTLTTNEVSQVDNSYLVRPYQKFRTKCITDSKNRTGRTIVDTSQFTPVDTSLDDYVVTVVNPPKPLLEFVPFDVFADITFMNETVKYPIVEGSNSFLLDNTPIGGVGVVSVNGVTLSTEDYTIDNNLVTISSGITLESTDIIGAYYNKTATTGADKVQTEDLTKLEIFAVTGITSGYVSNFSATTYSNFVNYNTENDRLEVFLKENIDPNVFPVLTVNGVNLTYNIDFFKSTQVPNKIILDEGVVIKVGDILTIYYYYSGVNNPGDLGEIKSDTVTVKWTVPTNILRNVISQGDFIVEFTDRDDIMYNNVLKTGTTIYNNTIGEYSLAVGPITSTSVENYIYRIRFDKIFRDEFANEYKTTSYSDNGSFRLDWKYINNTKF